MASCPAGRGVAVGPSMAACMNRPVGLFMAACTNRPVSLFMAACTNRPVSLFMVGHMGVAVGMPDSCDLSMPGVMPMAGNMPMPMTPRCAVPGRVAMSVPVPVGAMAYSAQPDADGSVGGVVA